MTNRWQDTEVGALGALVPDTIQNRNKSLDVVEVFVSQKLRIVHICSYCKKNKNKRDNYYDQNIFLLIGASIF
jgi:hypothetical protein